MSSLFGIGGGGNVGASGSFYPYSIDQSLRFPNTDSGSGNAYLNRTPSSASNRKTWTYSLWVKRSKLGSGGANQSQLIWAAFDGGDADQFQFGDDNTLRFYLNDAVNASIITTAVYRDVSSWYHIVLSVDTTQATAADRVKFYVNGEQVTSFSTATYPSQNYDTDWNSNVVHAIGQSARINSAQFFCGYLAEVNFIDGTALDPTSFGETINGVWVPKRYSGSYGTNGFYLPFDDSSAIGDDESGNTNDWTANNLAASDVVPDSPTNNFPVLIPGFTQTTQEGGLKLKRSSTGNIHTGCFSTMGVSSGKWYVEIKYEDSGIDTVTFGVAETKGGFDPAVDGTAYVETSGISSNTHMEFATWSVEAKLSSSYAGTLGSAGSYGSSPSSGDIIQIALDMDDKKIWYGVNGTYIASGDPASGTNASQSGSAFNPTGEVVFVASAYLGRDFSISFNFGQDSANVSSANTDENGIGTFEYAPPSGFLALCSANLPEPTISPNAEAQADDYFNTVLYTGNSGTNAITGVGFQPDFVWAKSRTTAYPPELYDVIRGQNRMYSSATTADAIGSITSFDSDGFTHTSGSIGTNASGDSIVAWNWKAGGTAVSNTDGSITSSVSAAPDAGFSIVSYTGTGANATVGHGLTQKPEWLVTKSRDSSLNWSFLQINDMTTDKVMALQATNAEFSSAGSFIESDFTATTFGVGTETPTNKSGDDFIAYCFHSVEGYSKVGSMELNNNADGTFVYLGFRPALVIAKRIDGTGDWNIFDSTRDAFNDGDLDLLQANTTTAESAFAASPIDLLSNGFKLRHTSANGYVNAASDTAIYLAFAEQPFKYANAR